MTDEQKKKTIQDNVLAAIEAGRVQMRPRWQFVLQGALMASGLVLAALALLFTGSFIIFMLEQNGAWFAPAFGGPGVRELFMALPLIFVAVALVFIILLQVLVRRYSFSYARPVLYSVIGIALFVVLGSFLVAQTHFHEDLFKQARDRQLPIAGGFYRQFGEPHVDRIVTGIITQEFDNGFVLETPQANKVNVIITPETKFPRGKDIDVRDNVIVLGDQVEKNGETFIEADGVRTVEGREDMFEVHRNSSERE